eukprot:2143506-Pyramimonas_sp.AAC.1
MLGALCNGGACKAAVEGSLWPGFDRRSGIRQGCPLSLLIFAACTDVVLRGLQVRLGCACSARAFADDM